jgi:hypothetical protein
MRARSVSFVVVASILAVCLIGPACGGNDETSGNAMAGSAGNEDASAGTGATASSGGTGSSPDASSTSVACGSVQCDPVMIPFPDAPDIPACCASAQNEECGLDTTLLAVAGVTFATTCQALNQPGELDESCPPSESFEIPGSPLPVQFEGCCRSDVGQCGYLADGIGFGTLELVHLGLGCVDAAPFLDGGTPKACGAGVGGAGGASGAAGSGG